MKATDRPTAVSALAPASASPAAVPAVQPSPRYNFQHAEWWFGRFDRLRALAAAEGPSFKVSFVGDSITEHWEAEGKAVWDRVFAGPKYKAINLGFGGDRTENVLWRILNGQLDGLDPDAVVVLVGTNNSFSRGEREEPPADTARAVAEIVRSVRERCPRARVVLHPILPSGEKPDDPKRLRDGRANELIRALEDGERVLWCDFGPKLLAPDGTLPKEIAPDFVHPGEKGYEIWAEALLPHLDRCLGYSDACPRQAFPVDARTFVWTNPLHAAKRDEIAANPERYYDIALVGDPVPGTPGDDARRAPLREGMAGVRFLDFPLASVPRVPTLLWAVEDAGLCDGYSARVVALPGAVWADGATPEDARRLLDAIRLRQPQATILLMPDSAHAPERSSAINDGLRKLADGERVVWFDLRGRAARPGQDAGFYALLARELRAFLETRHETRSGP